MSIIAIPSILDFPRWFRFKMFEKRSCKFVSADGNFHGSEVCLGGDGDLYPGLQHDFVEFGMFWPQPSNVKAWRVMLEIFGGSNHLQVCLAVSHSITPVVITSYPFTLSRFKEFGNNYIVSYCSYGFILFHVVPLGVQHDFATFAHFFSKFDTFTDRMLMVTSVFHGWRLWCTVRRYTVGDAFWNRTWSQNVLIPWK